MKVTALLTILAAGAAPVLGCLQVKCPVEYCAYSTDDAFNWARDRLGLLVVDGRSFIGRDGASWDGTPTFNGNDNTCRASGRGWVSGRVAVWRGLDDGKGIRQAFENKQLTWTGPTGQGYLGACYLQKTVHC